MERYVTLSGERSLSGGDEADGPGIYVDVAAAKGKSEPGLSEAGGTRVVDVVAAKGKSDPGLTEADGTGVAASPLLATSAKSSPRPRSVPASSLPLPPLPPLLPPPLPLMPPPRPHGSSESASRRRVQGWHPGDSYGRSELGARARAEKQERRFQAYVQKVECQAAARAKAIAAGLPPPPPPARKRPPPSRACIQCKYNDFAYDCDYQLCGKCCRAQERGTWCSYHLHATG